jgi:hypothetical protein
MYRWVVRLALGALLPVGMAEAAVFQRDWKTPGDGLLTYDEVNQREWLDLTETVLAEQFPFPGVDPDAKYQYVVSQTMPGGLFEGFTVAKSPDVIALAQSAGINTSTQSFAVNATPTLALTQLLGLTIPPNDQRQSTLGLFDEIEIRDPNPPLRFTAVFRTLFSSQSGLQIGTGQFQFSSPPGVMLYRVVPEPECALLLGFGAITIQRYPSARKPAAR